MDEKTWEENCQTFELDFHSKENYRWDKLAFEAAWSRHFTEWCGCVSYQYAGRIVVDVGCGSRPAIDFFTDAVKYYIDPLIGKFAHIPQVVDAWGLDQCLHSFDVPAEKQIHSLMGAASFVNCWNVLDHCCAWRSVLANVSTYARQGALVALSTDFAPHTGHVGIDDPEGLMEMVRADFDILRDEPGYWGRAAAMMLRRK